MAASIPGPGRRSEDLSRVNIHNFVLMNDLMKNTYEAHRIHKYCIELLFEFEKIENTLLKIVY